MIILFSLSAIALAAAATALLLPALRNRRPVNRDDSAQQNIRIARRRLGELAPLTADDETNAAHARAEIEMALLDDLPENPQTTPPKKPGKAWAVLIPVMIPLLSAGLYLLLGTPAALTPDAAWQNRSTATAPSVEALLEQLEEKLAANPGNARGWVVAGKTYMSLGRFTEAERAYQTLHQLLGDDPEVLTAWADAALRVNNGAFSPQIRARVERALEIRPDYDNALWLAALGAESRGEYQQAVEYMERLLPLAEDRRQDGTQVTEFIARLREVMQSANTSSAAEGENDSATGQASLRVQVRLDPKLVAEVREDHQVYVFANAVHGPPLAVSRHRASELPVSIILDDSMAMIAGREISTVARVSVMARLSRSGDAVARPGDIESAAVVTRTDNPSPLDLVINRVIGDAVGQ